MAEAPLQHTTITIPEIAERLDVCEETVYDLCKRQIDEDDVAGKNLDAEVGVNADEAQRHDEWRPEKSKRLGHHCAAAEISASTSVSNMEM